MKVTVREKPIKDGRKSLYLDFYPPILHPVTGKPTRREFLGLYVYEKPRLELERTHNRETRQLAQHLCATRQLEVQKGHFGFLDKDAGKADFLAFFKKHAETEKLKRSVGSRNNWMSVYQHLEAFSNGRLLAKDITEEFCKNFRDYLTSAKALNATRQNETNAPRQNRTIAYNSAVGYFTIFKTAIKRAIDAKILNDDPAKRVKRLTRKETQREFLALAELQSLAQTECEFPILKNAALFSALTGLRYSDVEKLTWNEVFADEDSGPYLRFTQKKTGTPETLPLSSTAYNLMGERRQGEDKVFPGLLYSSWQNQKLREWAISAGVLRPVTFHIFRHTFATLQLQQGTDIYTVSKLLGHRDISTTQIYAKIIDEQKRKAVNRIKLII